MKFSEDQIMQLLSAFWVQATLPDNMPSNIEAIAHSFILTLISVRLKVKFQTYTGCLGFFFPSLFSLSVYNYRCLPFSEHVMLQNPNANLVVRFFQLPLSLRSLYLDPNNGIWIFLYSLTDFENSKI